MRTKFFFIIIALFLIANTTIASAEPIISADENFKITDNRIEGSRYKIDSYLDNDGSGADTEDKKINCSWYEFWEWLDSDGECQIESYDKIYDKKTKETIIDWSMFKLQKKDKEWETPLIKDYNIIYNNSIVTKIIEYEDNSTLNVTYILNTNDIKWLLNITSGTDAEYRLKFRIKSNDTADYGNNMVGIGDLIYDWNDIKAYTTNYTLTKDYFEQYTYLGTLKADENIEIDPVITTDTLVDNQAYSNLMKDSSGNMWYVAKNTSHRLVYSNVTGSWALNSTNSDNFSASTGWASAITTDDVIHIADTSGATTQGYYVTFNTTDGTWTTETINWEGTNQRIVADGTDIYVFTAYYTTDEAELFKKNATSWYNQDFNVNDDRNTVSRGLAISDNQLMALTTLTSATTTTYYRVLNLSSWAWIDADTDSTTTYTNTAGIVTVNSTADEFLGCSYYATNHWLYCNGWNGTDYVGDTSWTNLASIPDLNETDSFYFGRTDEKIYGFFLDDGVATYVVEMNSTDVSNPDWDFEAFITFDKILDSAEAIQVIPSQDELVPLAYKEDTSNDRVYTEFPAGLLVRVYDESTGNLLSDFNITVTNQLAVTDTQNNIDSYYNSSWTGNLTIRVEKEGYAERYYYAYNVGHAEIDAYLLNYSDSQLVTFTVIDSLSNPINQANVTVERMIDGNWTVVAQRITGVTGIVSFYIDPDISYRITASADGYSTYTFIDVFTDTGYFITLYQTISTWSSVFTGIANFRLMPTYPTYRVNQFVNNTFTIASPDGWLDEFGMNVTSWNGTVLYSNTSNTSTGGQLFYNKNWTATDCNFTTGCNFTVLAYFTTNNSTTYETTKLYYITNTTSGAYSLVNIYENITGLGANKSWYIMFIVIIIASFVGSWTAFRYGAIMGGIVAELILAISVVLGIFDVTIFIINLILLGAVLFIISNISSE